MLGEQHHFFLLSDGGAPRSEHWECRLVALDLETTMNTNDTSRDTSRNADSKQGKEEGAMEKIAHTIDPSGREISDDELIDPGAHIPDNPPSPAQPTHKSSGKQ
jgi:hypothetical protein